MVWIEGGTSCSFSFQDEKLWLRQLLLTQAQACAKSCDWRLSAKMFQADRSVSICSGLRSYLQQSVAESCLEETAELLPSGEEKAAQCAAAAQACEQTVLPTTWPFCLQCPAMSRRRCSYLSNPKTRAVRGPVFVKKPWIGFAKAHGDMEIRILVLVRAIILRWQHMEIRRLRIYEGQ